MKKEALWFKGLIAVLITAVLAVVAFGQNDRAKDDLRRSFRRSDLQRIEQESSAHGRKSLKVKVDKSEINIEVEPNDLRGPGYRSEDSSTPGETRRATDDVKTFKGNVVGDPDSSVRVTIDGPRVEGYFATRGRKYFVEPAKKYTNLAADDEMVVYDEADSLIESSLLCESDIPAQIEAGKEMVQAQAAELLPGVQVIELATEADQQYVANFGSSYAANNEILSILNMTEGVYQTELNLSITVVYQHTWSTPDPFDGTSMSTLLDSFLNYWNANIPQSSVRRDATHLFTGKSAALSAGLAYVGTICRSPAFAYGLSGFINWAPGKYLVPTHEIGHNLGANHAEAAQNCAGTIMNAQLSSTTPLTFCSYSRNEITTYVGANGSCLGPASGGTPTPTPTITPVPPGTGTGNRYDFDGDGRADVSLFRPQDGVWYLNQSSLGFGAFRFGQFGDRPVPADYDGDGKTDAGVYRGGAWYRLKSSTGGYDAISFGLPTDIPTPGDFDGDGKADIAVFRPATGTWWILNSSNGSNVARQFGMIGDVPVTADFDGDGRVDFTVFRPSNGVWYRTNSSSGTTSIVQFGVSEDKPVAADFDGDRRADIAVWRPSSGTWWIMRSSDGGVSAPQFGMAGDIPAAADYDGDGRADVTVYRPSTGVWYRMNSSNGGIAIERFGAFGDIPAAGCYIQ
jgi:hypothetical protein